MNKSPTGLTSSSFGEIIKFDMPHDCDIVIVCVNNGFGLKPKQLLMPHQIYDKNMRVLLEEHKEVTLIPARSKDYTTFDFDMLARLNNEQG